MPVAGVLLSDWSVFALIALFWMENVIVGVLADLRDPRDGARLAGVGAAGAARAEDRP